MAGITTPFTTPTFPFLQTVSQRALDTVSPAFVLQNGPSVAPIEPTPTAGLGQGVFAVDGTLGSGYAQQWNASVQRELTSNDERRGRLRRLEDHARRHPGYQPESADRRAARARRGAAADGAESVLRHHPALLVARRPDDHAWRSCSSRIRSTRPSASIATTSARPTITASRRSCEQRLSRGLSYLVSYTRSRLDGRCLVGVRRVDPDRTGGELSGRRQLRSPPRARLLDRRHPARLRRVGGVGHCRGARAARIRATACSARWSTTGRWPPSSRCSRAFRSPSRRRPTSTRLPALARSGRTWSAIPSCLPTSARRRAGSTPPRSRRRRCSRSARRRATRSAAPATATSTWRSAAACRCRCAAARRSSCAPRRSTC